MTIRKLFERAAAVVLSLCLVGGVTGFEPGEFAVGAETTHGTYEYFEYENTGSSITITGLSNQTEVSDVVIPDHIDGLPVTNIGNEETIGISSFLDSYNSVTIPETVTSISEWALFLLGTKNIYVEDNNPSYCDIDGVLFNKARTSLIQYPIARIGDYTIPDTVKKIELCAFDGAKQLYHVDIPDSVNEIGDYCFFECSNLDNLVIPESVNIIGYYSLGLGSEEYSVQILNPECIFYRTDGNPTLEYIFSNQKNVTLYGFNNSTAQQFAERFAIPFKSLGEYKAKTNLIYPTEDKSSIISKNVNFSKDLNTILDNTSSVSYSPELAYMLSIMSQSAYGEPYIKANYHELGFENKTALYDYDTTSTQADNCGYVIGYQDLEDGTREYLITVRGTANGKEELVGEEWWSDFNLGFNVFSDEYNYPKYHHGFYMAAQRIWESLKKYNDGSIKTDKVRYVLTGHSRGAAVSNIISKWLIDEGVSKNDLYSYNFACPGVSIDKNPEFTANQYSSIFNINCARDIVGQAPGTVLSATTSSSSFWGSYYDDELTQWGKYGMTYFWDEDWLTVTVPDPIGAFKYHPCDTSYIPYLSNQPELSEFKTYEEMRPIQWKNTAIEKIPGLFGIGVKQKTGKITGSIMPPIEWNNSFSDLTVIIKDTLGNVVGTVKDKTVSIEKEYADRIDAQIVDGRVDFSIDADSGYQISVESETPATIAVSQENAAYNSVNNGAVYTAQPGNTTIDITPDTSAAETPVTDDSGKAIEPDKVWNLGDVNGDRSANIADAVLLQKWLLNKPDSDLTEWTAADIYEDGKLNVYDLTLLKQLITE